MILAFSVALGHAKPASKVDVTGEWAAQALSTRATTCGFEAGGGDRYRVQIVRSSGDRLLAHFELLTPTPTGSMSTSSDPTSKPIPHVPEVPDLNGGPVGDEFMFVGFAPSLERPATSAVVNLSVDDSGDLVGDLVLSYVSDLAYLPRPDLPKGVACASTYTIRAQRVVVGR